MTDLIARADRVKTIAESVGGKVLGRNRDNVRIEVPANIGRGMGPPQKILLVQKIQSSTD